MRNKFFKRLRDDIKEKVFETKDNINRMPHPLKASPPIPSPMGEGSSYFQVMNPSSSLFCMVRVSSY